MAKAAPRTILTDLQVDAIVLQAVTGLTAAHEVPEAAPDLRVALHDQVDQFIELTESVLDNGLVFGTSDAITEILNLFPGAQLTVAGAHLDTVEDAWLSYEVTLPWGDQESAVFMFNAAVVQAGLVQRVHTHLWVEVGTHPSAAAISSARLLTKIFGELREYAMLTEQELEEVAA